MPQYRVLRKFSSDRPHQVGEIVDFPEGTRIEKLLDQRYIGYLSNGPQPKAVELTESAAELVATAPPKRGRGRPPKASQGNGTEVLDFTDSPTEPSEAGTESESTDP